jgi:hypothetical protein
MTEPDQFEFHGPVKAPGGRSLPVRLGIVAGAAVLFVVGAVAVMGASPAAPASADPAATADPSAAADPAATAAPAKPNGYGRWNGDPTDPAMPGGPGMARGFGMGGPGMGGPGMGGRGITITGIAGNDLALRTDDGWARTITVTSDTTITKAGKTIAVGDLKVDDQIRFSQTRNADGTYKIDAIVVVVPTFFGQVSAVDGSTITIKGPGGTTATVHVSGDTTYTTGPSTKAALSDVKVGSFIVAEGATRSDGSLDATALRIGAGGRGGWGGPGFPGRNGPGHPDASPAPSAKAG